MKDFLFALFDKKSNPSIENDRKLKALRQMLKTQTDSSLRQEIQTLIDKRIKELKGNGVR